jgi:tetratricopeptide (TPR) repeat protein
MSNPANPQPVDYSFFDQIKYADSYHAKFRDAQWFSASSGFYLVHAKGSANPDQFDFTSLDKAATSIIRYATSFLSAYLKGDASAMEWMNKTVIEKGFGDGEVVERNKAGIMPPPSEATFTNLFLTRGSATARKVWDRVRQDDPTYQIASANSLNNMGYALIGQGEVEEAVVALELQTDAYPTVANAWDSLGEGYMANGDEDKAIAAFKKSLEMNPPQNTKANSISLLGQLGVDWVQPDPHPLTDADAMKFVGTYEVLANGQTVITNVSWEDGQLVAQSAGQPQIQLELRSENTFWAYNAGNAVGVTFEFVEFDNGKAVAATVTNPLAQSNRARRVEETQGTE